MLIKTNGIVLHTIPYSDTRIIAHLYTEAAGRLSCIATRTSGRRNTLSAAVFMPLSVIEAVIDDRPGRDLARLRDARIVCPLPGLLADVVKSSLALFLAEVLFRMLREEGADAGLFAFLTHSIRLLDGVEEGVANFHLVFLLRLLDHLGIYPNADSYSEGAWFDMQNGVFVSRPPLHRHFLDTDESRIFASLLRISYGNMSLYSFSRADRALILRKIISYYRLHIPGAPDIISLPILQTLFD
ncbi:MAG: DNA repair protein RecO [Tannerellaceae bacterium]|jgi:DNA repair protein RecO (recombination protein O)|nr:DNA repair protein RecO [Tannerellaceae bacterium]